MPMAPRVAGALPSFIGEAGQRKPTSSDGDLFTGSAFRELDSGNEWYYDSSDWKPVVTVQHKIYDELTAIRQLLERLVLQAEMEKVSEGVDVGD